jgi:hypothetical protein
VLTAASALFSGMTERDCIQFAAHARARTSERGELLYLQGQPVRSLIVLEYGTVKHTQLSSEGREVLLWMSGPGDRRARAGWRHTKFGRSVVPVRSFLAELRKESHQHLAESGRAFPL